MAQIVENSKGFKIITTSMREALDFGGLGICDTCNKGSFKGYIVCVLNRCAVKNVIQNGTIEQNTIQKILPTNL